MTRQERIVKLLVSRGFGLDQLYEDIALSIEQHPLAAVLHGAVLVAITCRTARCFKADEAARGCWV